MCERGSEKWRFKDVVTSYLLPAAKSPHMHQCHVKRPGDLPSCPCGEDRVCRVASWDVENCEEILPPISVSV